MTLVTFAMESEPTSVDTPTLDFFSKGGSRRFNLRKRSHDRDDMNLSSYNSAFLDGLFADVALASQGEDDKEEESPVVPETTSSVEEEARLDHSLSMKRSRVSLTKSISRSGRSYKNLVDVLSPVGVANFFSDSVASADCISKTLEHGCSPSMERINSLHFQLNSIDPSPSPKSVKSVVDIIDMAFPNLPATVSDSSCSRSNSNKQGLTRASDQQVSEAETFSSDGDNNIHKESYGWFVELDDDDDESQGEDFATNDPYSRTSSSMDLAFSAPTAPKRSSTYDAEVEWAKAADTVDDVLGDFF